MSDAAAEFAKLKTLHAAAVLLQEGGHPIVFLPQFPFRAAGRDSQGSQAGQSAGSTACKVQFGDQYRGGQSARPHHPGVLPAAPDEVIE